MRENATRSGARPPVTDAELDLALDLALDPAIGRSRMARTVRREWLRAAAAIVLATIAIWAIHVTVSLTRQHPGRGDDIAAGATPHTGRPHTGRNEPAATTGRTDDTAPQPTGLPEDISTASDTDASAIPAGKDLKDIAALRSEETMLRVEARLRQRIASGGLPSSTDEFVPFDSLASWKYTNGLDGMPPAVRALDGKRVTMVGFMLPISEVEDMREFLLVRSLWGCCYGTPPDLNGVVRVVLQGERRMDHEVDPVLVTGTFRVEVTEEDGYVTDIFQLQAGSAVVIR